MPFFRQKSQTAYQNIPPGRICVFLFLVVCSAIFVACDSRDKILYQEAERLWLEEHYDDAVSKLRVVVEEYPDSGYAPKALLRLGEIYYLNLDEPEKAIDYLTDATKKRAPDELRLKARLYIGEIYENSLRNYDLAILQYQKIIKEYKDIIKEDEYLYRVANAYFRKGDYAQAVIEFQSLLNRFPKSDLSLDARYQVANSKFISGAAKEALRHFQQLLKDSPGNKYDYDIRLGIAICYEELSQLKKALAKYKDMLKLYPDKPILSRKIDSIKNRLNKKLK
ncbi:hypothetical protein MNBD_NITROSPINAE02-605 [hydrothermal vent metagenome]|uniref:Uncharacterized protein n=1 Tax=hydrothermal vent metagenome TaxID=652676 RepID=A0A3B1BXD3_9ZZZZ